MMTRKAKVYILILIIVLFFISITLFYFQMIFPLQNKMKASSTQLKEEKSLSAKTNQGTSLSNGLLVSQTKSLQMRLPVSVSIENFLLELEKAEVASGSQIKSIVFVNDKEADNEGQNGTNSPISSNQDSTINGNNQSNSNISQNNQSHTSNQIEELLPRGVEKKSINLVVEAQDYSQLYRFVEEIESLQRITSIDSIQFDQSTASNDQKAQPLNFQITLSIFYYPSLENILKSAKPKINTPDPSNKLNPLESTRSSNGESSSGNLKPSLGENDSSTQTENSSDSKSVKKTISILIHKVEPGETLFSIAMRYYHSREGEMIIKNYNHLEGITVYSGTTLKIPINVK
jgi:type IV pilus assembly protein PilO